MRWGFRAVRIFAERLSVIQVQRRIVIESNSSYNIEYKGRRGIKVQRDCEKMVPDCLITKTDHGIILPSAFPVGGILFMDLIKDGDVGIHLGIFQIPL